MRIVLNDMLDAKGTSEPLREAVKALISRLEAAEKAAAESYRRGYATGQEEIEAERDALRTKIEAMERQEPYCWTTSPPSGHYSRFNPEVDRWIENGWNVVPLYALPGAQPTPSVPEGWLRAIDEALVVAHVGVANADDTYEQAKAKLDNLIDFHVDVATDPAVNGGWKLVPIEPTEEMTTAFARVFNVRDQSGTFTPAFRDALAAAPEAKP